MFSVKNYICFLHLSMAVYQTVVFIEGTVVFIEKMVNTIFNP